MQLPLEMVPSTEVLLRYHHLCVCDVKCDAKRVALAYTPCTWKSFGGIGALVVGADALDDHPLASLELAITSVLPVKPKSKTEPIADAGVGAPVELCDDGTDDLCLEDQLPGNDDLDDPGSDVLDFDDEGADLHLESEGLGPPVLDPSLPLPPTPSKPNQYFG